MISRFPTNTLLNIISARCNSIIKSKPIDFTTKTNVFSIYSSESTFLEKYFDQEKIRNTTMSNQKLQEKSERDSLELSQTKEILPSDWESSEKLPTLRFQKEISQPQKTSKN